MDILMFLNFAKFYQWLIPGFSRIVALLILILWITVSKPTIESKTKRKKGKSRVNNEVGDENNRSLCRSVETGKNTSFKRKFLTPKAKLAFTWLR